MGSHFKWRSEYFLTSSSPSPIIFVVGVALTLAGVAAQSFIFFSWLSPQSRAALFLVLAGLVAVAIFFVDAVNERGLVYFLPPLARRRLVETTLFEWLKEPGQVGRTSA